MVSFVGSIFSCICSAKALMIASYTLVAFVHFLALWTHHVFVWNTRFNCTGSGCPVTSPHGMAIECAVFYVLLVMLLLSYWRCILTPAGSPSPALNAQPQLASSVSPHTALDFQVSNTADFAPSTALERRR
jgi:hypothetical protein